MAELIGLKRGIVRIHKFNSNWHKEFLKEKSILEKILQANAMIIEHVGSTSIPNAAAKPIIDIAIGVKNRKHSLICKRLMIKSRYYFRGEHRRGELFFAKGPENNRTHYIRILSINTKKWREYIVFREAMSRNKTLLKKYLSLKKMLEKQHSDNRKSYTKGKDKFIKEILEKYLK